MHLLVRETRGLEESEAAIDLGLAPAPLFLLAFSDTDLGAAARAWEAGMPRLGLANIGRLRHPLSVDLLVEQVVAAARCVVIRLLGGVEYWRYGLEEMAAACRARGIPLAVLPGDGRPDAALDDFSSVAPAALARLGAYLDAGGRDNFSHALHFAVHLAGLGPDDGQPPVPLPACGELAAVGPAPGATFAHHAAIVFYRAQVVADDMAPIAALGEALAARGFATRLFFVASLKDSGCAAYLRATLTAWRPAVVLNATLFSARDGESGSPLDAADAPVLQLVMAGAREASWRDSPRGLSEADFAMQVVLPELDGRLLTTAISFKAELPALPGLDFCRTVHAPHAPGIALAADRAAGWARLAATGKSDRRLALVLSNYPGGQTGHAVGLDSFASLDAIAALLRTAGYAVGSTAGIGVRLGDGPAVPFLSLAAYTALCHSLPEALMARVADAWGDPADDPAVADGWFALPWQDSGALVVAVQPDRGAPGDRRAGYHDPDTPPRHAYVAFYLWLRAERDIHALLHLGTHGTLEWLPGKAVALGENCFPQALVGGLAVINPFIVNNPGEAACARRRLGAVTIGHLTPPLGRAENHGPAAELERLIDEYAAADGLDRRRARALRDVILDRADALGLLAESGAARGAPEDEALARLDAYLCDVKTLQIRDGLHVYGRPSARRAALLEALVTSNPGVPAVSLAASLDASPAAENQALLAALDGRFVPPGPAGAPSRGRADVLPTGRNLSTLDPRMIPTRSAMALAERTAAALLRRHRQDHGDWPRRLVIDLWGSAGLRTGGEDLSLALILLGARPSWDGGSNRVTGFEILPLALLDRPRVDVTLRISGFFRDVFETQIRLFDAAVRQVAARDEAADWNPLAGEASPARIFGPAPGSFGAGGGDAAGYLTSSAWSFPAAVRDPNSFSDRVAAADVFLHVQDHAETDLLDSTEYAAHEGGFAAAAAALGATPALYHADAARPDAPVVRRVDEEIARVVRGRAANPAWIAGMMRHGRSGASEITRALDALSGFAATLPTRFDRQFDLLFDATLGDPTVAAFLAAANRPAHDAMAARFAAALRQNLWRPRRNDVGNLLP